MPDETIRAVEAVTKLLRLTQSRDIEWEASYPDEVGLVHTGVAGPYAYVANHMGRMLRLYRKRGKKGLLTLSDSGVVLDLVGKVGFETLWWFPDVEALEDLYQAVMYQTSGAESFLDELLGE